VLGKRIGVDFDSQLPHSGHFVNFCFPDSNHQDENKEIR
jgi:hypothetical protein